MICSLSAAKGSDAISSRSGASDENGGGHDASEGRITPSTTVLEVVSTVRLDQVRTVDRKRLLKRLGKVEEDVMRKVDEAISISLDRTRANCDCVKRHIYFTSKFPSLEMC